MKKILVAIIFLSGCQSVAPRYHVYSNGNVMKADSINVTEDFVYAKYGALEFQVSTCGVLIVEDTLVQEK